MKVYACPINAPVADYANYDPAKEAAKEEAHQVALKSWLRANGFDGPNTGKVIRFQVADGYAQYMVGDGAKSALIHLPYGDAYSYPDAAYLPKAEVLKRIKQADAFAKLFANVKSRAS